MNLEQTIALALAALIVEGAVGYPDWLYRAIGHPVSWIGRLIGFGERLLNDSGRAFGTRRNRGWGLLAGVLLIVGYVAFAIEERLPKSIGGFVLLVLCASTLIAQRSLYSHVRDVADALDDSVEAGRAAVGKIVGRNVTALDEAGVARAAIESLAENFSDGVVAPTFWMAVFGLPGAALYKAINTADSMIGHKTKRYKAFGFAAAKVDDAVNWPPARFAGGLIVAAAALGFKTSWRGAWRMMRRDSGKHLSPNAGWPEAAMAGALGVKLGGPRGYGGAKVEGAWLGEGDAPVDSAAIRRALALYRRALVLQFVVFALVAALLL